MSQSENDEVEKALLRSMFGPGHTSPLDILLDDIDWLRKERKIFSTRKAQYLSSHGDNAFRYVQPKHRLELSLVLKGFSFGIRPGKKVGVIRRTGVGKSSIVQALFRTVEICGELIEVDGRDLKSLRQVMRLAIIPQDVFLFAGTVRKNIDPEGTKSNVELDMGLNLIHFEASDVTCEKSKLDSIVENEGSNFRASERQLISIAHCVQTVVYYDRIPAMDVGEVVEFANPHLLFGSLNSIFCGLCDTKASCAIWWDIPLIRA
ncbi:uncharacterized protein L203_104647 [Cryptococcus depauperatus CBS 7841]|uniref:ABC transporter domain-containing protein n=1 Tax=Cryptococcus depauperatus CBS 7841 TaxID=1295531 RepID=A0A1E3ILG1_9TREE|nr:hypothetical protein L203_02149 [Cryptococcus depauperatus CBS 7841]